jgi:hypothetical protein
MVMTSMDGSAEEKNKSCADVEYHSFSSCQVDINDNNIVNLNFKKLFLELSDREFNDLLRIRLKLPVFKERNEVEVEPEREYWLPNYTIEQLFNDMSETVEFVTVKGKSNQVCKYRDRALKIFKLAGNTKSNLDFVINFSDLSLRLIAEPKVLDKMSADHVLKQAVGKIFESIDSNRYCSLGIAKRITVRFDK